MQAPQSHFRSVNGARISLPREGPERLDDALIALDEGRQLRCDFGRKVDLDLSTRELACKQMYFPCNQILQWWLQDFTCSNHQFQRLGRLHGADNAGQGEHAHRCTTDFFILLIGGIGRHKRGRDGRRCLRLLLCDALIFSGSNRLLKMNAPIKMAAY